MFDEANKDEVQIGYHNNNDSISTFIVGNEITLIGEEEIFKKPDSSVLILNIEDVKIDFEAALGKAREFQKSTYSAHQIMKELTILQHLDLGVVYNITFVTSGLKTLNIKIHAKDGSVVAHELISLMDLKKN
jgi:hypothetical protein